MGGTAGKIGEKKNSGGPEIFGGDFLGKCKKGVEKLFGGSKKCWDFFGGHNNFLGENFSGKKKKRGAFSGKKGKIFPKKFRGDFLGGSYTGGRVWGECWEIKDKIGEKNFRGPEILGGTFWGNAKKGWKNFFGGVLGEL